VLLPYRASASVRDIYRAREAPKRITPLPPGPLAKLLQTR